MSQIWAVESLYGSPRLRTSSAYVIGVIRATNSRPSLVRNPNVPALWSDEVTYPAIKSENEKVMRWSTTTPSSAQPLWRPLRSGRFLAHTDHRSRSSGVLPSPAVLTLTPASNTHRTRSTEALPIKWRPRTFRLHARSREIQGES